MSDNDRPAARWPFAIVRTAQASPGGLTPHPLNWRLHPRFQQDALSGVLGAVGWVDDVLVNETTGHILDGHLRVELALDAGEATVPVSYVALTETQEIQVLTALDPIAAMAHIEHGRLQALTDNLTIPDGAVQTLLDGLLAPAGDVDVSVLREDVERPEVKPLLEFKIVVGPYRFTVDLQAYTEWVNDLYSAFGSDSEAVKGEIMHRLGLDAV